MRTVEISARPQATLTEKVHILAVLENHLPMTINETRMKLDEYFSLKPSLTALWKNLERCSEEGLVLIAKSGRVNYYTMTAKGKKRLTIIRTKRQKLFSQADNAHRGLRAKTVTQQNPSRSELIKRVVEAKSAQKICEALLTGNRDQSMLNLATLSSAYWEKEYLDLIPHISEETVKMIEEISGKAVNAIDRISELMVKLIDGNY